MPQPTTVPLLDLKAQYATIRDEVRAAVDAVLESQQCILGPVVADCEAKLAEYCRCPHAVTVSSGSDALLISLMAEDIGPGDEVITTPYTFFATAGAIARVGAKPVFVDIDPTTYNIDPAQIEAKITPRTKAIMPVHLYGQCAEMDPILAIADRHGIPVIEDAAQAIGSEYKGRRAGSMGRYGCFSFFPSKNLGAAGDGGLVTTSDAAVAEKLRVLRDARLEAEILPLADRRQFPLRRPSGGHHQRQTAVSRPLDGRPAIERRPLSTPVRSAAGFRSPRLPGEGPGVRAWCGCRSKCRAIATFTISSSSACRAATNSRRIWSSRRSAARSTIPFRCTCRQCFAYLGHREGDFPESERAARETLALPIYPELSDPQAEWVVECIGRFLRQ